MLIFVSLHDLSLSLCLCLSLSFSLSITLTLSLHLSSSFIFRLSISPWSPLLSLTPSPSLFRCLHLLSLSIFLSVSISVSWCPSFCFLYPFSLSIFLSVSFFLSQSNNQRQETFWIVARALYETLSASNYELFNVGEKPTTDVYRFSEQRSARRY